MLNLNGIKIMKKIILSCMMLMATSVMSAQSALELAKQQKELDAFNKKMLNAKPTKSAKKQAKELKAEGWTVPAGEKSIEQQVTTSQLYGEELMATEEGTTTKRFLMHTAIQTAGTYNVGYAAARTYVMAEVAGMIKTQLVSSIKLKADNVQNSAITATTVDKFNQKVDAIVDETLTGGIPMLSIYRMLQNGNFEVQVRLAFDKKEILSRMKKSLQRELEGESNALFEIAEDVMNRQL